MKRIKIDCSHLEMWTEYGQTIHDCLLGYLTESGSCKRKCSSYLVPVCDICHKWNMLCQCPEHLKPLDEGLEDFNEIPN